jgi:anti-sigma factor RsiW
MARITHYSSSTLAEATVGKRLPTEPVVKAFVTACGEDPAEWIAMLRQADTQVGATLAPPTSDAAPPAQPDPQTPPGVGRGSREPSFLRQARSAYSRSAGRLVHSSVPRP